MKYKGTKKDIEVVLVGGRSCGKAATGNALLGKAACQNGGQSYSMYSMHQQSETLNKSKCYFGQESTKQFLRKESASRCGRLITVVHTADTMTEVHLHETRNKQKSGVKVRQKKKKKKVVIFYVVYRKFTKDDDDMLDKLICELDEQTRKKLFIVLTDYAEDAEGSQFTCRKKIPIIHVNSSLTAKENEDQIKEIIKDVLKEKNWEKKKSGVITIRLIRSTGFLLLWALSVLGVLEAKVTHVRRNADIVKWNLMTKPVIFGENVDLECIIEAKHTDEIMTWTKIPHGETIALNKIPVNVQKYDTEVVYNKSQVVYKLTIKSFNMVDVNCLYRCDYGFNSVGDILSLNDKDFIAKPSEKDVKSSFSLTDFELIGNIQIKNGYPAPTCTAKFQGQNISEIAISNNNDSIFVESRIEIKHRTTFCRGTIMVTCTYENQDFTITDDVNMCPSTTVDQSHSNGLVYVIAITSGILILILVVCVTIKKQAYIRYMFIG